MAQTAPAVLGATAKPTGGATVAAPTIRNFSRRGGLSIGVQTNPAQRIEGGWAAPDSSLLAGGYYGLGTERNAGKFTTKVPLMVDTDVARMLNSSLEYNVQQARASGENASFGLGFISRDGPTYFFKGAEQYHPDALMRYNFAHPSTGVGIVTTQLPLPGSVVAADYYANSIAAGGTLLQSPLASNAANGAVGEVQPGTTRWATIINSWYKNNGTTATPEDMAHFFAQGVFAGLGEVYYNIFKRLGLDTTVEYELLVSGTTKFLIPEWQRVAGRPEVLKQIVNWRNSRWKNPDSRFTGRYAAAALLLQQAHQNNMVPIGGSYQDMATTIQDRLNSGLPLKGLAKWTAGKASFEDRANIGMFVPRDDDGNRLPPDQINTGNRGKCPWAASGPGLTGSAGQNKALGFRTSHNTRMRTSQSRRNPGQVLGVSTRCGTTIQPINPSNVNLYGKRSNSKLGRNAIHGTNSMESMFSSPDFADQGAAIAQSRQMFLDRPETFGTSSIFVNPEKGFGTFNAAKIAQANTPLGRTLSEGDNDFVRGERQQYKKDILFRRRVQ